MYEYSDISTLKNGAFCDMISVECFPYTTGEHKFAAKKPTPGSAWNRKNSTNPGPCSDCFALFLNTLKGFPITAVYNKDTGEGSKDLSMKQSTMLRK